MTTGTKNPLKVAAGKKGASLRWGPRRLVRLDNFTPGQRQAINDFIDGLVNEADVIPMEQDWRYLAGIRAGIRAGRREAIRELRVALRKTARDVW